MIDEQSKIFHTTVAKLLYLAKRACPDILTATSFLCTRVKSPMEEELQKLIQTLGYLRSTQQTALVLKHTKPMQLETYIDAVFVAHNDSKSHSGVAMFIAKLWFMHRHKSKSALQKAQLKGNLCIAEPLL